MGNISISIAILATSTLLLLVVLNFRITFLLKQTGHKYASTGIEQLMLILGVLGLVGSAVAALVTGLRPF